MRRRMPLIVVLLMLLLGGAWWMLLISPRDAEIRRYEDELVALQDEEARLRVEIRELEQVRDREPEYLVAVAQLETLVPDQPRLDDIIDRIHALSIDTGILLQSMAPAEPSASATADLREIQIAVRIEGEFFQLLNFLFGLNDMERLTRVDAVAINSVTDGGVTSLVVALQVRAFTLADVLPEVLEPLPPVDGLDDDDGAPDDPTGPADPGGDT